MRSCTTACSSLGALFYAQRLAASALCNLSANHDENKKMSRAAGLVDALIKLLMTSTDDTVQVFLFALYCMQNPSPPASFLAVFRHIFRWQYVGAATLK